MLCTWGILCITLLVVGVEVPDFDNFFFTVDDDDDPSVTTKDDNPVLDTYNNRSFSFFFSYWTVRCESSVPTLRLSVSS